MLHEALTYLRKYRDACSDFGNMEQAERVHEIIMQLDDVAKITTPGLYWNYKPLLGIDFDGVISEYFHPWEGEDVCDDDPVPGAAEWIDKAVEEFTVCIFSTRCNTTRGREFLAKHCLHIGFRPETIKQLVFLPGKPPFFCIIDDRAIKFNGDWSQMPEPDIFKRTFEPWNAKFKKRK